jgi:hypothetical protein
MASLSALSLAHIAVSLRSVESVATNDFVAATLNSGPASIGSDISETVASGLEGSLTIDTVRAPASLAIAVNSMRSSLRPDWEMVSTS